MAYFNKWVPEATKNKARYSHCVTGETNFLVFICQCGSSVSIWQEQFALKYAIAVPYALQEWVKEHRHVCKKFHVHPDWKNGSLSGKMCEECGWNEEAHEKKLISVNDSITDAKNQSGWPSYELLAKIKEAALYNSETDVREGEPKAVPVTVLDELPILEQPTGRKFRK